MYGASRHEQETLGATDSNRKQQENVAAVYSPTTNLCLDGVAVGLDHAQPARESARQPLEGFVLARGPLGNLPVSAGWAKARVAARAVLARTPFILRIDGGWLGNS